MELTGKFEVWALNLTRTQDDDTVVRAELGAHGGAAGISGKLSVDIRGEKSEVLSAVALGRTYRITITPEDP